MIADVGIEAHRKLCFPQNMNGFMQNEMLKNLVYQEA